MILGLIKNYYFFLLTAFVVSFLSCGNDDSGSEPSPNPTNFEGNIDWIKTFGGSQEDNALSVVMANDGGYVFAGYSQSVDGDITDKDATDSDFWVVKLTSEGTISWSKTYGGSADDRAEKIITTNDGGYAVVGYSRSNDGDASKNEGLQDYWIIKIDATGNLQWEQSFGFGGIDRGFSLVQTSDNGYFVTGFLDVTASDGGGNDDAKSFTKHGVGEFWGIKLDASGNMEWRRYFGGTNNDRSYDVITTPDDAFLMIGSSESDDFDITNPKGSYDYWIVKVNNNGEKIWEKNFGGTEIDVAYGIAATDDGNYIIIGDSRSEDVDIDNFRGNADLWMIKIAEDGNLIWKKSFGGTEFDTGRGICKTNNNTFIITGNTRSNDVDLIENKGQSDALTLIINKDGEVLWKTTHGGSAAEFATGCVQAPDGEIIIVGSSESSDGDIPNPNKGIKDALIIKYK